MRGRAASAGVAGGLCLMLGWATVSIQADERTVEPAEKTIERSEPTGAEPLSKAATTKSSDTTKSSATAPAPRAGPITEPRAGLRAEPKTGPNWSADWQAGWKQAVKQEKPLLLFFKTPGCVYCRQMANTTYRDAELIKRLDASFVSVTPSAEQAAELTRRMRIRLFPTTVVVSPENRVLVRVEGYVPADKLRRELDNALAERRVARKP